MALGRQAAGVFGTNVLNLLLAVGNSIFLTRTLGVVGRGEFAVFSASVGLLTLLLGLGINVSVRYWVAKERVPRERILGSLLLFAGLVTVVVLVAARLNHLLLDNALLLPEGRQELLFEATLAGVVGANVVTGNLSSVFAGHRRFTILNLVSIGHAAVSLVVWFTLFRVEQVGLTTVGSGGVFLAYLGLTVGNAAALAVLGWRSLGIRPTLRIVDPALLLEMIRYAAKAFAAQVAQFLNYRVDIWIVQTLLGAAPLGLYSLAANLAMMLWLLPRSVSQVLMPSVAAEDAGTTTEEVARIARLSLWGTAGVAVAAAATSHVWIGLLYGSEFSGAGPAFGILLAGCVPFSLSVVLAATLSGMNRLEENLVASVAGLVVTVVLDLLLIPRFGIVGAAAASSASYLVTTVIVVRAYARIGALPVRALLVPRREDLIWVKDGLQSLLR